MIAILSLGVAIGTAFAVNYLDPTVQDEINVEDETGLPVLATIQHYGTELKGL
jgi:capsular polysaccharide biosynthesis protein